MFERGESGEGHARFLKLGGVPRVDSVTGPGFIPTEYPNTQNTP